MTIKASLILIDGGKPLITQIVYLKTCPRIDEYLILVADATPLYYKIAAISTVPIEEELYNPKTQFDDAVATHLIHCCKVDDPIHSLRTEDFARKNPRSNTAFFK